MASNKNTKSTSILGATGLNGKTFTGLNIFSHGTTVVIEIVHSTGSQFIKVNKLRAEYGGDHDFGSGTEIVL